MKYSIVILSGGIGTRLGEELPKQFLQLQDYTLLDLVIDKYKSFSNNIIVTLPLKYLNMPFKYKSIVKCIEGGSTRQLSCFNALKEVSNEKVIITDACRPFIKTENIQKCLDNLYNCDGVVTVSKTVNTVCDKPFDKIGLIYNRTNMYDLTMPQCFETELLFDSHKNTNLTNTTDDIQVLRSYKKDVVIKSVNISFWEGFKLTNPDDLLIFKHLLDDK